MKNQASGLTDRERAALLQGTDFMYTHVTGDMQKNAAAIVGGMVKKLKLEDE